MLFAYFMLGGGIFLFTPPSVTGKLQLVYAQMFQGLLGTGRTVAVIGRLAPLAANTPEATDYTRLKTMQRRLRNHVANLQARLEEAQGKIDRLAGLRAVPEWNRMSFLPAGIINDPGPTQTVLLINRGQEDGVVAGQCVLGDFSVIGVVSDVSAQTARVKLLTDPSLSMAVRVAGVRRLMQGCGSGEAVIPRVNAKNQPKAGDPVYVAETPGFPGVAIIAAEVVESTRDPDSALLLEVKVQPVCDITSLKEVHVVMPGK